jgi:hypothetical protein
MRKQSIVLLLAPTVITPITQTNEIALLYVHRFIFPGAPDLVSTTWKGKVFAPPEPFSP